MDDQIVPAPLKAAASLSWRFLLIVGAVAVIVLAAAKLRLIVVPTIVALLLSTQLVPPARWLRSHGWPNVLASIVVLAAGFAVIAGAFAVVVPPVLQERDDLRASLQQAINDVSDWLSTGPMGLPPDQVNNVVSQLGNELSANTGAIIGGVVSGALKAIEALTGALLTLFLLFFFVKDGETIWNWVVRLFPRQHEPDIRAIGVKSWRALGGYVRGVAMVALGDAILVGISLRIVGVPFVLPLATITFLGALVPIAGLSVAGGLAALVALVTKGAITALVVVVAVTGMVQFEGHVLHPFLVGRSVNLHPVAILLSVAAGAVVWGIIGAFLAVPLTLVINTTISHFARKPVADALATAVEV